MRKGWSNATTLAKRDKSSGELVANLRKRRKNLNRLVSPAGIVGQVTKENEGERGESPPASLDETDRSR